MAFSDWLGTVFFLLSVALALALAADNPFVRDHDWLVWATLGLSFAAAIVAFWKGTGVRQLAGALGQGIRQHTHGANSPAINASGNSTVNVYGAASQTPQPNKPHLILESVMNDGSLFKLINYGSLAQNINVNPLECGEYLVRWAEVQVIGAHDSLVLSFEITSRDGSEKWGTQSVGLALQAAVNNIAVTKIVCQDADGQFWNNVGAFSIDKASGHVRRDGFGEMIAQSRRWM